MKKLSPAPLLMLIIPVMLVSCKGKSTGTEIQPPTISVTSTRVQKGTIEKDILLNGQTIFLKKNRVVSPISGYLKKSKVSFGDKVSKGDLLFELETRESKALNSTMGDLKILAPAAGVIGELAVNQSGAYILEGNLLCTIVENKDLMIQVNVPFEYNALLNTGDVYRVMLSDQSTFNARITKILPTVDVSAQTRTVLLQPASNRSLPENLNLTIEFTIDKKSAVLLIDKEALVSNENQSEFWLMKILDDTLAIKVPVKKGIENDSLVEISSSYLEINDLIINRGAYGLEDSTVISIEQ